MSFFEVIESEQGNDVLVWKHPKMNFNNGSKLIVGPAQKAIVIIDGKESNVYNEGSYQIKTGNEPFASGIVNYLLGGEAYCRCAVYFFNMKVSPMLHWDTPEAVTVQYDNSRVLLRLNASGTYSVRIKNPRQFFKKIANIAEDFATSSIESQMNDNIMADIKTVLSKVIVNKQKTFLEISSYLRLISDILREEFLDEFEKYGLLLENFNINDINVVEDETYNKLMHIFIENYEKANDIDLSTKDATSPGYEKRMGYEFLIAWANNSNILPEMTQLGMGPGTVATEIRSIQDVLNGTFEKQNLNNRNDTTSISSNDFKNVKIGDFDEHILSEPYKKRCPVCQSPIGEHNNFCYNCGATLQTIGKICPSCGNEIASMANYCPQCGKKL
ncbi:MAG: SPFH domain-containing protein [Lachnospiraceae bacterium]|nr:SPFH domain-containing protein [Lachnospiraceae bacterium]